MREKRRLEGGKSKGERDEGARYQYLRRGTSVYETRAQDTCQCRRICFALVVDLQEHSVQPRGLIVILIVTTQQEVCSIQ